MIMIDNRTSRTLMTINVEKNDDCISRFKEGCDLQSQLKILTSSGVKYYY